MVTIGGSNRTTERMRNVQKMKRPAREAQELSQQLENFRYALELDEKSLATIQKYLHDAKVFLDYLEGKGPLCKERTIAFKAWLAQHYAVRSANSMLTAVNQFLRFIQREECCVKLFRLQYQTFCDERKELSRREYEALLESAGVQGRTRLLLILQTICATGIRISELRYITVEALHLGSAVAKNKGKSRVILIPSQVCQGLLQYAREQAIESGPVFVTRSGKPVDRSNVWREMKALCEKTEVIREKVFPHNLRHLFACTFYEKEKDVMHLADILGHKNVNTTRIYVLSNGEEHRMQIEALDLFSVEQLPDVGTKKKIQHNGILCCTYLKKADLLKRKRYY